MPGIVIVGAGFGGIGMGIALKKAGYHDFVILDKARDLGGTWRDNQYPGCACDVPSPLYSYSFELNPDWSRLFAPQQEIWDYLRAIRAPNEAGYNNSTYCLKVTLKPEFLVAPTEPWTSRLDRNGRVPGRNILGCRSNPHTQIEDSRLPD